MNLNDVMLRIMVRVCDEQMWRELIMLLKNLELREP